MTQKLTVVVTGSTGKQGGAVARDLLERGHKVRAVTRDPNSKQAKLLANAGAALVAASLEDTAAIVKALEGATSLFAMTTPFGGTDAEIRQVSRRPMQPRQLVHLVFTSVGSAQGPPNGGALPAPLSGIPLGCGKAARFSLRSTPDFARKLG